jgi:GNAT superfamily N-acetyltransferase
MTPPGDNLLAMSADGRQAAGAGLQPPLPLPPPAGLSARMLGPGDLAGLLALRRQVVGGLADEDWYVLEPDRFAADHLGRKGETVGLFAGDALIAYAMLGLPPGAPVADAAGAPPADPMADLAGVPAAERGLVAHLASTMVRADRRGCGLHKWLIRHRLARCAALGRVHVMAMVSPRNPASWHNLMRYGLAIHALAPLEGDRLRYLLYRDLRGASGDGPA